MRYGHYLVGALCLALGVGFVGLSAPAAVGRVLYPSDLPLSFALFVLGTGVLFLCMAAYFWVRAVKLTPGDDILADRRGLLVSVMVVTAVVLVGGMLWSMADVGFWRDTIAGMLDGTSR
jgi:membrane protein implicated in regulation of membrane protease activity